MADEKDIAKSMLDSAMERAKHQQFGTSAVFVAGRLDVNTHATLLTDMTPVAANAKIEIAKQQYAVPAQEHTKQEVEITKRTKQLTVQHVVVGGVVSLCAVLAFLNSNSGAYLAAMAAVMGGVYGVSLYVNKTTPKLPPKEDDTK